MRQNAYSTSLATFIDQILPLFFRKITYIPFHFTFNCYLYIFLHVHVFATEKPMAHSALLVYYLKIYSKL